VWERKEPVRATGVPTPPPRRHRNFLVSPLLVYSYMRDQRQLKFPIFTTNVDTATGRQMEWSVAKLRLPAGGLNCLLRLRVRLLQIQHLLSRFLCQVKRKEPKRRPEFHLGGARPITIAFTCLCSALALPWAWPISALDTS
jgi:hypothetical protein